MKPETNGRISVNGKVYLVPELEAEVKGIFDTNSISVTEDMLKIEALANCPQEPRDYRATKLRLQAQRFVSSQHGLGVTRVRTWRSDNRLAKELPALEVAKSETDSIRLKAQALHAARQSPETNDALKDAWNAAERALVRYNETLLAAQRFEREVVG